MFRQIRKHTKKIIWALIISFVIWGGGTSVTSRIKEKKAPYAGLLFGKRVSYENYFDSLRAVTNQARLAYGDKFSSLENYLNLKQQAWDRILLIQEAKKRHIKVTDAELKESVQNIPYFQSRGAFDYKIYEMLIKYTLGAEPRQFEEEMRQGIMLNKLLAKLTGDISPDDAQLKAAYIQRNEKADATYLLIEPQRFIDKAFVTENELQDFYEKNKQALMRPEEAKLRYIEIPLKNTKAETQEKNTKDEEKNTKAEDKKQEAYDLVYDISDFINENAALEDISKKIGLEIKETDFFSKDASEIPQIGWSPELIKIAFELEKGKVSNPIETPKGYYIAELKEKKAAYLPEPAEAKSEIETQIKQEKSRKLALDKAIEILNNVKNAEDKNAQFENAEKEVSFPPKSAKDFTRDGYIEGLGVSPEFALAAFSLERGEFAKRLVNTPRGYAIIRLDEIKPIDEKKYEEEKESFRKIYIEQEKQRIFSDWFAELKSRANLKSNVEE